MLSDILHYALYTSEDLWHEPATLRMVLDASTQLGIDIQVLRPTEDLITRVHC